GATPRGVLALKAFFARRETAGGASAARVKDRIRELLASEDTERPLSDDQIMRQLRGERLHVSRRTVGKYREELCVPPAARRRGELQPEGGRGRPRGRCGRSSWRSSPGRPRPGDRCL